MMIDQELRDRMIGLTAEVQPSSDPMSILEPRIRRRRTLRRTTLVVALAGAAASVAAVVMTAIGGSATTSQLAPLAPPTYPPTEAHRYAGPPLAGLPAHDLYVLAEGRLASNGARWVFLAYGTSCTALVVLPAAPPASPAPPESTNCIPPGQPQPTGGYSVIQDPKTGRYRMLADGKAPSDVTSVRLVLTSGSVLHQTVRTTGSPADPSHRYFMFEAGRPGFPGHFVFFNAQSSKGGSQSLNYLDIPPTPEQRRAAAGRKYGYPGPP